MISLGIVSWIDSKGLFKEGVDLVERIVLLKYLRRNSFVGLTREIRARWKVNFISREFYIMEMLRLFHVIRLRPLRNLKLPILHFFFKNELKKITRYNILKDVYI